jgi:hypothetical protein
MRQWGKKMARKINVNKSIQINIFGLIAIIIAVVIVSSFISWGIVSGQAAPRFVQDTETGLKTNLTAEIAGIHNSMQHMQDAETAIGNYTDNLNNTTQVLQTGLDKLSSATQTQLNTINTTTQTEYNNTQTQFGQVNNTLSSLTASINGDISSINSDISGLKNQITGDESNINILTSAINNIQNSVNNLQTSVSDVQTTVNNLTITIPSGIINSANDTNRFIWTADTAYQVTQIVFQQSAIENTSNDTTLMVCRVPDGTAISSGMFLLANPINLQSNVTANTTLSAPLTATTTDLQLASGDSLALDFTNAITEYSGCVTITLTRMQN